MYGAIIAPYDIYLVPYPKYFTPSCQPFFRLHHYFMNWWRSLLRPCTLCCWDTVSNTGLIDECVVQRARYDHRFIDKRVLAWNDSERASLSPRRSITRQKKALLTGWFYSHFQVCQFQKFLIVTFFNSHSTGTSRKVVLDKFKFLGNCPPTPPLN